MDTLAALLFLICGILAWVSGLWLHRHVLRLSIQMQKDFALGIKQMDVEFKKAKKEIDDYYGEVMFHSRGFINRRTKYVDILDQIYNLMQREPPFDLSTYKKLLTELSRVGEDLQVQK